VEDLSFSKYMYEEGEVRLVDLMNLLMNMWKEEIMNAFQSTYGSDPINSMKLTKIVEELCEMRRGENNLVSENTPSQRSDRRTAPPSSPPPWKQD